jgi:hypothetical protein
MEAEPLPAAQPQQASSSKIHPARPRGERGSGGPDEESAPLVSVPAGLKSPRPLVATIRAHFQTAEPNDIFSVLNLWPRQRLFRVRASRGQARRATTFPSCESPSCIRADATVFPFSLDATSSRTMLSHMDWADFKFVPKSTCPHQVGPSKSPKRPSWDFTSAKV